MKIFEIFKTLQGEGFYIGHPTTFVRFAGCSLACPGCDTVSSWKAENKLKVNGHIFEDISGEAILDEMLRIDPLPRHICITGGEPLEQNNRELARFIRLILSNVPPYTKIVLETGGHIPISGFLSELKRLGIDRGTALSFSIDYKPISSGKHERMILSNFDSISSSDLIKFVCRDVEDFLFCVGVMRKLQERGVRTTVLFHSHGGLCDKWLADHVLSMDWSWASTHFDVRYGVQLHKMLELP